MNFDAKEIFRLELLRGMASEFRDVQSEAVLATGQIPVLQASEKKLRQSLDEMRPSKLLAFDEDVRNTITELRRVELVGSALSQSAAVLGSRLARLKGDITREFQDTKSLLNQKIADAFFGEDAMHWRKQVSALTGETVADKADALITLCRKLGAVISESSPATEVAT